MSHLQNSRINQLIDRACSAPSLPSAQEMAAQIVQEVNSRADTAKIATLSIKKKLQGESDGHILYALLILEKLMKNCGNPMHIQVGTRDFMNALILLLHSQDEGTKIYSLVLVLIEDWGKRFEKDKDILPLFKQVYDALKGKGYNFKKAVTDNRNYMIEAVS